MAWPSTVPSFTAGAVLAASKLNDIRDALSTLGDAWTTYVPTWSSSGTAISLGNASITGRYRAVGKTIDFRILLVMGSSTTYGTGVYNFSLPFTPTALTSWEALGSCVATDSSASDRYGLTALYAGGSNVSAVGGAAGRLGQLVPFTWASTDRLSITGRFELT